MTIELDKLTTYLGWGAGIAAAVTAPITAIAAGTWAWAWRQGWGPRRPLRLVAASWSLPAVSWAFGNGPGELLTGAWTHVMHGEIWGAMLPLSPWVIPLGLTEGAIMWMRTWARARAGKFSTPRKAATWADRQFRHAMRRAGREAKRAGLVPTLNRKGDPVIGRAALVTEGAMAGMLPAAPRLFTLALDAIARHMVIVGEPGVGKTVLLMRVMRTWLEGTWLRHLVHGGDRPLLIFVDCKGGGDGAVTASRFSRVCEALGLAGGRVGQWPSRVRFDLWGLPPERLVEVLTELLAASHPFYDAMKDELVALAVLAPLAGPPTSSADFLRRLDPEWLTTAWAGHSAEQGSVKDNAQHFAGIAARYRTTFRALGRSLDSGRHLDDFDAIVATLEGTQNARTASAQAQALVELITDLATRGGPDGDRRKVLLVIDEFSAISERVQVSLLMERARSLGIAVIPAGQSFVSLGPTPDERERLVAAAAGGMLLMGTAAPEKLADYAGTEKTVEVGIKKLGDDFGDEGTGRAQDQRVVNPNWLRAMGGNPGQVVYVDHGRATWGQVTPVEVTDDAPSLAATSWLRKHVEKRRITVITRGDRIPVAELEAALATLDDAALAASKPREGFIEN